METHITVDDKNYTLRVNTIETGSNYNMSVHLHEDDDKVPIWGTIVKEGADRIELIELAFNGIISTMKPSNLF